MLKSFLVLLLLFNGLGCASNNSKKNLEEEQSSRDFDLVSSIQLMAGYGVSIPVAGVGYLADGMIYTVGSVGIFGVMCFPLFLATSSGGSSQHYNPCLPYAGTAFKTLERNHPKFGHKIWNGMEALRQL